MVNSPQDTFRAEVRELFESELRPLELEIAHGKRDIKEFFPLLMKSGLQTRTLPQKYGGDGADFSDLLITMEELARVSYPVTALIQLGLNLPAEFIGKLGSDAVKDKYLPEVPKGRIFAEALSEPEAGSALTDMKTAVTRDGDGYVLNGRKCWVSYGNISDFLIVFARFGESTGAKGIGAVVVPTGSAGISIAEMWPTMSNPTKLVETVFDFDNVRVGSDDVLVMGDPSNSSGFKQLMSAYNTQRLGNAANCLGLMRGAYELAAERLQDRKAFGRPIAEFQGLRWKLTDMAMKIATTEALMYKAANITGSELPNQLDTSLAKLHANESCLQVTSEAMQLFGGYGYRSDFPLEYRFRVARGQSFAGGTTEVQRNMISNLLLGSAVSQRQ